jgi:hypothetical protein
MHTPVRFLTHSLIAPITAAVLLAALTSLNAGHHELVIQGGSVIDTRTGKAMENQTLVIEGDRITRVAPAKEVTVPSEARAIEAYKFFYPTISCLAVFQGNNVTGVVDNKVGGILQGQPKPCPSAAMSTVYRALL